MKIWSLTYEKAEELRRQLEEKVAEVQNLEATAPSQLWISDLDEIEITLDERASDMAKAAKEEGKAQAKARKVQAGRNKKAGNRKAKQEWDWRGGR
jgi:DNA topoisomerase-2